jgi:NAD+ kinase
MNEMKIGIVVKPKHENALPVLKELIAFLNQEKISFLLDPNGAELMSQNLPTAERVLLPKKSDLIVVLGGDGTLLAAARHIPPLNIPIMGINLGRVGFLTEIPANEMVETLKIFLNGKAQIQERMMLETTVFRDGKQLTGYKCLNDVVITKGALARIVPMKVETKNGLVADVFADGLILSTPTGSTAYNLAAGGPIVMPGLSAIIITPLCPQTLSLRPIILPADEVIEITIVGNPQEVFLTSDGQMGSPLIPMDRVTVRKSPDTISLIMNPKMDYFSLLRDKLGWASR